MRRLALLSLLALPVMATYTYFYSETFTVPCGVNTSYWTVTGC